MEKTEVKGIYKVKEGVLINRDNDALSAYKKQKKQAERLRNLESDVDSIKNNLDEIKTLLKGLVR